MTGDTGYVGWSLGGLSQIRRCSKNLARDKATDGINFDADDNFCLDGLKLVRLDKEEWIRPEAVRVPSRTTMLHQYAPENSSGNHRVFAYAGEVSGESQIRTFAVLRPNGHVRWYGESDNSRMWGRRPSTGQNETLGWMLSGDEHRENRIDYEYVEDPTNCQIAAPENCNPNTSSGLQHVGVYISKVRYTRWLGSDVTLYGGDESLREIQFTWSESHPSSYRDGWQAGLRLHYTRRLVQVDVFGAAGQRVRHYLLNSEVSTRTGRDLLASVHTLDMYGLAMPKTRFLYTTTVESPVSFDEAVEFPLPFSVEHDHIPSSLVVADVTGDDLTDVMYVKDPADPYAENQSLLARSNGSLGPGTFASTQSVEYKNYQGDRVFDADLDLDSEFVHVAVRPEGGILVTTDRYSQGDFTKAAATLLIEDGNAQPFPVHVDFDGDGKQELVLFTRVEDGSNANHFYRPSLWALEPTVNSYEWATAFESFDTSSVRLRYAGGFAKDINGDGRMDFVYYDYDALDGRYLFVDDDGEMHSASLGFDLHGIYFADLNGDHLADAVQIQHDPGQGMLHTVRFNTGDGFTDPVDGSPDLFVPDTAHSFAVRVGDFNEDGRDDLLLLLTDNEPQLWVSDGKKLEPNGAATFAAPLLSTKLLGSPQTPRSDLPQWEGAFLHRGVHLLDANGDGVPEIVAVSVGEDGDDSEYVFRMLSQRSSRNQDFADMLIEVEDGLGNRDELTYRNLAEVVAGGCTNVVEGVLKKCVRTGVVVSEHRRTQDGSPSRRTEYSYSDAMMDVHGRGFVGFGRIEAWDPIVRERLASSYDLSAMPLSSGDTWAYPLAGIPWRLEKQVLDANDLAVYSEVVQSERSAELVSAGRYRVRLDGRTETLRFDQANQSRTTTAVYSEHDEFGYAGKIVTTSPGGTKWVRELDHEHRPADGLLGLVRAESLTAQKSGLPTLTQSASYEYDSTGQMTGRVFAPESTLAEIYDRTDVTYWPGGMVRRLSRSDLSETATRSIEFSWSPDGTFVVSKTNQQGYTEHYEHSDLFGTLTQHTDANGRATTLALDSFGRVRRVTRPDGTQTEWTYLSSAEHPFYREEASSDGSASVVYFDRRMRPVRHDRKQFDGTFAGVSVAYNYRGQLREQTIAATPGESSVPKTTYEYDEVGTLVKRVAPNGHETTFVHEGFDTSTILSAIEGDVRTQRLVRDHDGRVVSVELRDGSGPRQRLTKEYDAFGRLRAIDEDGFGPGRVSYVYDRRGRVELVNDKTRGIRRFTWDNFDQLRRMTESKDNLELVTGYEYDQLGRITERSHDDGATVASTRWIYSETPGFLGLLKAATRDSDGDGTAEVADWFYYDSVGRVVEHAKTVEGELMSILYGYDAEGRVAKLSYPEVDGQRFAVSYSYNDHGHLAELSDSGGASLWRVDALDLSKKRVVYNDSFDTTLTADPFGRLIESRTSAGGHDRVWKTYSYLANGQLAGTVDKVGDVRESLEYDALGRLSSWERLAPSTRVSERRTYDYDDSHSGSLSQVRHFTPSGELTRTVHYDLAEDSTAVLKQVDALELGRDVVTTYQYDELNRETAKYHGLDLVRATTQFNEFHLPETMLTEDGALRFLYGSGGQRAAKVAVNDGVTTTYHGSLYERRVDGQGTSHTLHLYADAYVGRVLLESGVPGHAVQYAVLDHRGSVAAWLDGQGEIVARHEYSPFGALIHPPGTPVVFATHQRDDETDLFDMKARLFDGEKRRFLTADPIFLGFDAFSYTHNDPINRIDPDGRCDDLSGGGCGAGGAGATAGSQGGPPVAPPESQPIELSVGCDPCTFPLPQRNGGPAPAAPSPAPTPTQNANAGGYDFLSAVGDVLGEVKTGVEDFIVRHGDRIGDGLVAGSVVLLVAASYGSASAMPGGAGALYSSVPGAQLLRVVGSEFAVFVGVGVAKGWGFVIRDGPRLVQHAHRLFPAFIRSGRQLITNPRLALPFVSPRTTNYLSTVPGAGPTAHQLSVARMTFGKVYEGIFRGFASPTRLIQLGRPFVREPDFALRVPGSRLLNLDLSTWKWLEPHLARGYLQRDAILFLYPGAPPGWPYTAYSAVPTVQEIVQPNGSVIWTF